MSGRISETRESCLKKYPRRNTEGRCGSGGRRGTEGAGIATERRGALIRYLELHEVPVAGRYRRRRIKDGRTRTCLLNFQEGSRLAIGPGHADWQMRRARESSRVRRLLSSTNRARVINPRAVKPETPAEPLSANLPANRPASLITRIFHFPRKLPLRRIYRNILISSPLVSSNPRLADLHSLQIKEY